MRTCDSVGASRRQVLRATAGLTAGAATALIPSGALAGQQPAAGRHGVFDVTAFGATGVRAQNATGACQAAIDACTKAGGGTVRVPPGEYSVGAIQLKDHVTLHVEAGATLFLLQEPPPQFQPGRRAMIYAEHAANIAVTGRGRLDGLAQYEFVAMRGVDPEIVEEIAIARAAGVDMRRYYRVGVQAYMIILNDCRNVLLRIRDLSVRWSAEASEPKWQSALVLRDVAGFSIDGFTGRQGARGSSHPAVLLDGATGGTLQNVRGTVKRAVRVGNK